MGAESRAVSDLRGRLVKTVDPLGGVTTFYYDVAGRIVRTTNALGLENLQRYDDGGQRVSVKDASLGEWTYAFDVYGDVVGQTDPRGKSASLIYDALGRLTARRTADEVTAWTYDTASNGIGRLASSSSGPRRGKRYAYDGYGRLVGVVVTVGKDSVGLKDSHDELGRLVRRTYTTGVSITNAYDTHGFWTSVAMKDGPTARQVYQLVSVDAAGRVTEEVAGDGIRSKHQFDDATGRLLATATRSSAGVAQDLTLTYDVVGNVTARADAATGESDRFEYDALARLTRLTSAKTNIQVSYDALGNITSKSDTGVYKYCDLPGQAAMLCSVQDSAGKSRTLAYDDAGNVTRFGEKLLTYTADGRVASIVADNLGLVRSRFTYDAEGALETQDSRDKTTAFKVAHLGDIEVLRERFTPPHKPTSERTRIRHFIATPTGIAGFYEQNFRHYPYRFASPTYGALQTQKPERVTDLRVGLIFFVKDQVGSLRAIVDVRGKVLDRFSYDPWGKRTDADSDRYKSVRQGFTGHESLDHLDLVHMGGRLYSPELGRFLSPDPLIQAPGFSQSHNRYSYVLNNPLRLIDPSGYGWDPIGDIGNAIGGVVGGIAAGISGVVDAVLGKPMTWLGEQIAKGGRWLSQNWQTVVVIAAAVALGPAGLALNPLLVGAIVGGLDAGLHGGNMQDVLRGAALGAVFSGVSYGMNTGINQAVSSSWGRGALQATGAGLLAQAAGGDFRKGFVTSAVMRLASPGVERLDNSDLRIAVEATAAGVAAELNGDNFEDAALRAAFQRMFTDNIEASRPGSHVVRGPVTAIAGKIWNLPNTAVGIVYGLAGYAYGWAAGYNPSLEFEDGTLHVKNSGLMSSAMTMGNVIVFGPDYGPGVSNEHFATTPSGYTVGQEEYLHTVQGEVLGPLYFPAHIIGGTISLWSDPLPGYSGGDKWHQNNAFETGPMTGNGAFRLDPRRRRRGRRSVGRHPSTRRRNVSRRIKVAA
jgi:RHS repeat-associated protein